MKKNDEVKKVRDCKFRKATADEKEKIISSLTSKPIDMQQKSFDMIQNGEFLVVDAKCIDIDDSECILETEFDERCEGLLRDLNSGDFEVKLDTECKLVKVDKVIFVYLKEN